MAYEYDRLEREDGGGAFLMGLLAGTVLGAGLGMLFAPKAGSELRNQLSDQAGKLRSTATDTYQQASEKVGQTYQQASEKVGQTYQQATDKVNQTYQQATDKVTQVVDRGKDAYDKARSNVTNINSVTSPAPAQDDAIGEPSFSTPGNRT